MSQSKPEWRVLLPRKGSAAGVEVYAGDQFVCQMSHHPAQRAQAAEYARRIVACVNACEGLPDAGLKPGILMRQAAHEQELIAQRDELLAALELVVSEMDKSTRANVLLRIHENAKAAIAKAKGGAV